MLLQFHLRNARFESHSACTAAPAIKKLWQFEANVLGCQLCDKWKREISCALTRDYVLRAFLCISPTFGLNAARRKED